MVTEIELQQHSDAMEEQAKWISQLEQQLADLKDQVKEKRDELKEAQSRLSEIALQGPGGEA